MKAAILSFAAVICFGASLAARRDTVSATTVFAIEKWVAAVQQHIPGQPDSASELIEKMTFGDRRALSPGVAPLLNAIAKKSTSVSSDAEKRIVQIGLDLARDPGPEIFFERAALLHSDAAMFGFKAVSLNPPSRAPSGFSGSPASPLLFEKSLPLENDGEVVGAARADWNWVFARSLLEKIEPAHSDDAFIAEWFHATTAFMFYKRVVGEVITHLKIASAMLPDDARIAFDRGCYAEMQGMPRSQGLLSDEDMLAVRMAASPGFKTGLVRGSAVATMFDVKGADLANEEAERLYRHALELEPSLFDARVRLARLLTLQSRNAEALKLFSAAPRESMPSDKTELFLMHLFRARAERGLGDLGAAAKSAHEAELLFPDAQSALMAVSQIAILRADTDASDAALRRLSALPSDPAARVDPWWTYDTFTGRIVKNLLDDMWARARAKVAK